MHCTVMTGLRSNNVRNASVRLLRSAREESQHLFTAFDHAVNTYKQAAHAAGIDVREIAFRGFHWLAADFPLHRAHLLFTHPSSATWRRKSPKLSQASCLASKVLGSLNHLVARMLAAHVSASTQSDTPQGCLENALVSAEQGRIYQRYCSQVYHCSAWW